MRPPCASRSRPCPSQARRVPTSASSAAATRASRPRCTWRGAESTSRCSSSRASAGAHPGATAARRTSACGATSAGSRGGWGAKTRAASGISRSTRATHLDWLIETYGIDCDLRLGHLHADHRARYSADSRRHVEHLRTVYDYPHIRFVDRDEVASMVISRRLPQRQFRCALRPPACAQLRARHRAARRSATVRACTRAWKSRA